MTRTRTRGWWQSCRSLESGRRPHPENHPRRVVSSSGSASPKASINLPCEQETPRTLQTPTKMGAFLHQTPPILNRSTWERSLQRPLDLRRRNQTIPDGIQIPGNSPSKNPRSADLELGNWCLTRI